MSLSIGSPIPSFSVAVQWINGEVSAGQLLGRPALIHFWAISCPLCKTNMPYLHQWKSLQQDNGIQFVAVHSPQTATDTDESQVERFITDLEITEPCAIDTQGVLRDRFQTGGYWPYYFLF